MAYTIIQRCIAMGKHRSATSLSTSGSSTKPWSKDEVLKIAFFF